MSDQDKSGQPTPASADLPAADATPVVKSATPSGSLPAQAAPAFGVFTASRGSGLARGKRPAAAAPSARPAAPTGYKPTSLEVINPQSEYKNPFTGETSVGAPATPATGESGPTNEPPTAEIPAPAEAVQPAPVPTSPVPESSAAVDASTASAEAAPKPDMFPYTEEAAKPELNILPPEPTRRPDVRWESPSNSAPHTDQPRPTFQPERERREQREKRPFEPREPREQRPFQPRDPRDARNFEPRAPREPRRDDGRFEPRNSQPQAERSPQSEPAKKSGGFLGWLKGLFGGGQPAEPPSAPGSEVGQRRDGGQGGQRHHRGGRGGHGRGGQGGFRDDRRGQSGGQFQPRGEGGHPQGESGERSDGQYGDGQRRRRRRGGRGRFRGEGDDRGPRPEGQQGGGAV